MVLMTGWPRISKSSPSGEMDYMVSTVMDFTNVRQEYRDQCCRVDCRRAAVRHLNAKEGNNSPSHILPMIRGMFCPFLSLSPHLPFPLSLACHRQDLHCVRATSVSLKLDCVGLWLPRDMAAVVGRHSPSSCTKLVGEPQEEQAGRGNVWDHCCYGFGTPGLIPAPHSLPGGGRSSLHPQDRKKSGRLGRQKWDGHGGEGMGKVLTFFKI